MPAKKTAKKMSKKAAPKKAKKTAKKATKKAAPKKAKKTTKTEVKAKKGKKIKAGQAYECGICGFRFVVDECGCVEEHYFICCQKVMKQKAKRPAQK